MNFKWTINTSKTILTWENLYCLHVQPNFWLKTSKHHHIQGNCAEWILKNYHRNKRLELDPKQQFVPKYSAGKKGWAFHQSIASLKLSFVISYVFKICLPMDFFIYGRNCCQFFFTDFPTWLTRGGNLRPKLHPRGGFFWPYFFIIYLMRGQSLFWVH